MDERSVEPISDVAVCCSIEDSLENRPTCVVNIVQLLLHNVCYNTCII